MKSYGEFENLRRKFEKSQQVKEIEEEKDKAVKDGNFMKVAMLNELKDKMWNEVISTSYTRETSIIDAIKSMEEYDRCESFLYLNALTLMVDCFDFILASLVENLQKYDKSSSFDQFDTMVKLGHEYKKQLDYILKNGTNEFFVNFADNSTLLREAILEKVKEGISNYRKEKREECSSSENTNKNQ